MTWTKVIVFAVLWYFIGFWLTATIFGIYILIAWGLKKLAGTPVQQTTAFLRSIEKKKGI